MSAEPLRVGSALTVPADELRWRFGTSGGPGGQHANRTESKAELSIDVGASPSIPPEMKARLLDRLGPRARRGVVTVAASESRSQWRNRAAARRRMAKLLAESLREPRTRKRTRPGRAARERRLEAKRRRSETKRLRRRPDVS
jgi:ribosome-associated protein